ncbi:uroporphyrinogen decarboxylase family protein [Alistipes sp.]|uniref:uroporphyrinogen decarboxylase family protein n=1 Tax=Alistipes sp. TaxID=1872444 RepID=UPI0025C3A1AC|nr:uroporphyrinogen decarboxylase family protein [Alistipes sp.]
MNMNRWANDMLHSPIRHALPIMTHPGIEMVGHNVLDAVTDGDVHAAAILALDAKYPAAGCTAIMDLTVEAEAFGAQVLFNEKEIPNITGRLLHNRSEVEALQIPDMTAGRIPEYLKADRIVAGKITDKPVFAGAIGPFSLAGRLYDMTEIMMAIYTEPDTARLLLEKCTAFLTDYLRAIKQTGVSGVIIAEPAAGLLSNDDAMSCSTHFIRPMVEELQDENFLIVLHNCGNTGHCTESMVASGARALHFGNKIDMVEALRQVPDGIIAMGNLDPVEVFRQSSAAEVAAQTEELLERTASYANFIISSGCDTPPGVPEANIEAFYTQIEKFNRR